MAVTTGIYIMVKLLENKGFVEHCFNYCPHSAICHSTIIAMV